ncbi:hypothetical protein P175DRAFT_0499456 [Aspergillus ochraceoroseus IBT 24754]|uniref:Uncharacterized protein n=1 Tax=Aspergillus ochraceoroseus IBT 24754 TaxID=1392256 RepID=A0A2T5M2Y8_9EURO|nr:uncharacterized protein P175DRAFT_0499456 [Aspergillus ochraceoroseus IBT 24754]PTU22910.1 hypothetical protein P175DRAFT_0499456 [Aspergillus ochraceoroseus IBT 24754]
MEFFTVLLVAFGAGAMSRYYYCTHITCRTGIPLADLESSANYKWGLTRPDGLDSFLTNPS